MSPFFPTRTGGDSVEEDEKEEGEGDRDDKDEDEEEEEEEKEEGEEEEKEEETSCKTERSFVVKTKSTRRIKEPIVDK